jgi:D-alanyl-D-alanine carboxypeptidase
MRKRTILLGIACLAIVIIASLVAIDRARAPAVDSTNRTNTSGSTSTKPQFDKAAYSTTNPVSPWVVVNKQHPLQPINYAPADLTPVGNGQYMRLEAANALRTMLTDAAAAGHTVTAGSGYRSYATQVATYNSEVAAYGQAVADSESARAGYSEHQTGWAIDLDSGGCNIADCFASTPGGKWTTANAYKYGFILRYPADLTDITGYRAEAWHFRYVGVALATELHNEHIQTLEQFFGISGGTTYR